MDGRVSALRHQSEQAGSDPFLVNSQHAEGDRDHNCQYDPAFVLSQQGGGNLVLDHSQLSGGDIEHSQQGGVHTYF